MEGSKYNKKVRSKTSPFDFNSNINKPSSYALRFIYECPDSADRPMTLPEHYSSGGGLRGFGDFKSDG